MLNKFFDAPNESQGSGMFANINWQMTICFSAIFLIPLTIGETRMPVELVREILSHYNKTVAPSFENSPTEVGFVYVSRRIHQFDEPAGTLTVDGTLFVVWLDKRLRWNDDPKYKNMTYFFVSPNEIWKPKMNVFNSGRAEHFANGDNQAICRDTGNVWWRLSVELHPVYTPEDPRWYPRDAHTCTLSLGSLYPQEISGFFFGDWDREMEHDVIRNYEINNPHWDLLELVTRRSYVSTTTTVIFYPVDDFIFTIRRQGWPLVVAFLPLMICCTFLSWSCFALPLRGKQLTMRMSVATYSLVWSSFFLLVLIDTVPGVGHNPPVIVKVNVCVVIMAFLTSLHTIVVSRVHRNSTSHLNTLQKLPRQVQYLLGLNKAPVGDEDGLLENTECSPDSGQKHLHEESILEDEADIVETAYDRVHLTLQITVSTLTIVFLCLV